MPLLHNMAQLVGQSGLVGFTREHQDRPLPPEPGHPAPLHRKPTQEPLPRLPRFLRLIPRPVRLVADRAAVTVAPGSEIWLVADATALAERLCEDLTRRGFRPRRFAWDDSPPESPARASLTSVGDNVERRANEPV